MFDGRASYGKFLMSLMTTPSDTTSSGPSGQGMALHTSRRHARQLALQMLFQQEFQDSHASWEEQFWATQTATPEVKTFASSLHQGVLRHQSEIDSLIQSFSVDWAIDRMPVVDRNILRCAIYELLWEPDIPAMVTINEAVELAKRFADEETKGFVNGILDHIFRHDGRLADKHRQAES